MTTTPALGSDQLLAALNWRYATKVFDASKKIPTAIWDTLEQALVLSPSSFGLQPWKFVIVTDAAVKTKLVPASWNQTQPADCSHFVVFAVKKNLGEDHVEKFLQRSVEVRGGSRESLSGYAQMIKGSLEGAAKSGRLDNWQAHQIYIALGQFMTSAALIGVDTCPMEGIDPAQYDEILGLTGTEYTTVVAAAAGYRAATDKYATAKKVRFVPADVIVRI
jgi:nitroreductase